MREAGRNGDRRRRFPPPEELSHLEGQPTASDILGLNGDGAYREHLRRQFNHGEADAETEELLEQSFGKGMPGAPPGDHYVEITGKYALYTDDEHVIQANSLTKLAWKVLRYKLGKIVMGD